MLTMFNLTPVRILARTVLAALFLVLVLALWAAPAHAQTVDPGGGNVAASTGIGAAFTLATLAAAVKKLTSLVKAVKNKDLNGVITPLVAIGLAFVLLTLLAHSDFTPTIPGLDVSIQRAAGGTLALLAVVLGLTAAFGHDWLNARDNSSSQAEKPLILPRE